MWIRNCREGTLLSCQIQPRASRSEVVGLHGDPPRLKIRVAAPPVDGEANEELIALLSKILKIPKKRFQIASGRLGKFKEILISGADANEVIALIRGNAADAL